MSQLNRRGTLVLALAATLSPALPAIAQTQPRRGARGDWLAMVRQHHRLIERSFDELLERNDAPYERRILQLRNLDQILTAHSLAEETAIYPALALAGLEQEAEHLYQDEAHAKIALARVELAAPGPRGERDWVAPARALREMVLRHATEDEEGRLFPELHRRLGAAENRRLADAYTREFGRVIPVINR